MFAILFSTFSTAILSSMLVVGIYLIGNNISQVRFVGAKIRSQVAAGMIHGFTILFPNLEFFSLGTQVTYGLPVGLPSFLGTIAYAILWICVGLLGAGYLVKAREI